MTSNQIGELTNWQLTQNKWGYMVDIQQGENAPAGSLHYLGGPGAYSWQGFFSTKFVNNPRLDTVIMTMSTRASTAPCHTTCAWSPPPPPRWSATDPKACLTISALPSTAGQR
ncbi:MAG: hypothetical protein R2719_09855 [Micropruina sp.]